MPVENEAASDGIRLQKVLAVRGFGSRRIVEDLIEEGRVSVNGRVAVLGRRVDVETDAVEVDGRLVEPQAAEGGRGGGADAWAGGEEDGWPQRRERQEELSGTQHQQEPVFLQQ